MSKITILHLSDLHYSSEQRNDLEIVLNALCKDLVELKKEKALNPDFIIFSGDLVFNGDNEQNIRDVHCVFLNKLLETLNLKSDLFFIVPGNHDVQKNNINEILEFGMDAKLKGRNDINLFIDSIENNLMFFDRLSNFNRFKKSIDSKYEISSNVLYSTYCVEINGLSVGLACLNSAWRASGKSNNADYGSLLVGERQIDNALKDFNDVNLKIGIFHHPFEWLCQFEASNIKRRAFSEFDILFFGHNHEPDSNKINSYSNNIISNHGGCLYQTRDYFNGYTIITYNTVSNEVTTYLREYSDPQREFVKATKYVEEGEQTFYLQKKEETTTKYLIPLENVDTLHTVILNKANYKLISTLVDSCAPKTLKEIFVEPLISEKTKNKKETTVSIYTKKKETCKSYTINDLIIEKSNFLIMGEKESGKTTLIDYIAIKSVDNLEGNLSILPVYFNFSNIPQGKPIDSIKKSIILSLYDGDLYKKIDIDKCLAEGKCLFLIDDISFNDRNNLKKLRKFIKEFSNNKYIFTTNEQPSSHFGIEQLPDIGIEYKKIHIQPFNRHRIRKLIENWFQDCSLDVEKILERIINNISRMHLPRSPQIISMLLYICENEKNYVPTNRASLLEKFFEIIMGKLDFSGKPNRNLDYSDKEHYLAYLASKMVNMNQDFIENIMVLNKMTIEYFEARRGLKISSGSFVDYFFEKGILAKSTDDKIKFKFTCFYEFFVAKRMVEDNDFYINIINENNYLQFGNEIDYMTGLQMNNKELVTILDKRIDYIFKESGIDIELSRFEKLKFENNLSWQEDEDNSKLHDLSEYFNDERRDSIIDESEDVLSVFEDKNIVLQIKTADKDEAINLIESYVPNLLNYEEKIDIFEKLKNIDQGKLEKIFEKKESLFNGIRDISGFDFKDISTKNPNAILFSSLCIFSRVIKNSELIEDLPFRKSNLKKCVSYWAKKILFILNDIEAKLKKELVMNKETENENISIIIIFSIFQTLMFEELASDKLEVLLLDGINDPNLQLLEVVLFTFLYSDLKLPDYIVKIKDLTKRGAHNKLVLNLISIKLRFYYIFKTLSAKEKNSIIDLITEINIMMGAKAKLKNQRINVGAVKNDIKENLEEMSKNSMGVNA